MQIEETTERDLKMRNLCLNSFSIRLAVFLSFSFSSYSFPPLFFSPRPSLRLSLSSPPATAGDILSLLGPEEQASDIDSDEVQQLWSCLKFLVPFRHSQARRNRSMVGRRSFNRRDDEENELIWRPPAPVLELARLAVDSAGDPGAIHRALDPSVIPVGSPYPCLMLKDQRKVNVSLREHPMEDDSLTRFHAKEYPACDKQVFPLNMGYCQKGSNVAYDNSMNLRNILWLAPLPGNSSKAWVAPGVLVVLDARPGGIIYRDIIPDYVQIARTIYEDDFGEVAVDVNYLNIGRTSPNYQIFIC